MTKEEVFEFIGQRLSFGEEIQSQLRRVNGEDFKKGVFAHLPEKCNSIKSI